MQFGSNVNGIEKDLDEVDFKLAFKTRFQVVMVSLRVSRYARAVC